MAREGIDVLPIDKGQKKLKNAENEIPRARWAILEDAVHVENGR